MSQTFRKILVPTDGSPESESVFPAIMPFVRAYAPEVDLLHVMEHPEKSFTPPERLPAACAELRSAGVNAFLKLREGDPAVEILQGARDLKADLIALSTHGRSGVGRVFGGSVTEAVLRRTELPLLVTRPGTVLREWNRVVIALDGSPAAEEVLPDAVRLARSLGASVELLRVGFPTYADVMSQAPMTVPVEDPMPYLEGVAARLGAEGVQTGLVAPEGGASREILRHLAESAAPLLCMTTHGRRGLDRFLLGSVAEQVLRHAPCPVFLRRITAEETGMEFIGARVAG